MTILIVAAALLGVSVAALVYAALYRKPPKYTYLDDGVSIHQPTELPGLVDRTLGNLTNWSLTRRVYGFEDSAALRAIKGSDNPWQITLRQYYALVVLASLVGGVVGGLLFVMLAGLFASVGAPLTAVPIAAVIGVLIGALTGSRLPLSLLRSKVNKRDRDVMLHLHEALDMFSMGTTTGASITQAMELTYQYLLEGPLRDEIGRIVLDQRQGVPFKDAITNLHTRIPTKRVQTFVRMLKDANADGLDRTDRLRREAAEMREDQQRTMEKRAGLVQMVFIAAIIGGLLPLMLIPFIVPFASSLMNGIGVLG